MEPDISRTSAFLCAEWNLKWRKIRRCHSIMMLFGCWMLLGVTDFFVNVVLLLVCLLKSRKKNVSRSSSQERGFRQVCFDKLDHENRVIVDGFCVLVFPLLKEIRIRVSDV